MKRKKLLIRSPLTDVIIDKDNPHRRNKRKSRSGGERKEEKGEGKEKKDGKKEKWEEGKKERRKERET